MRGDAAVKPPAGATAPSAAEVTAAERGVAVTQLAATPGHAVTQLAATPDHVAAPAKPVVNPSAALPSGRPPATATPLPGSATPRAGAGASVPAPVASRPLAGPAAPMRTRAGFADPAVAARPSSGAPVPEIALDITELAEPASAAAPSARERHARSLIAACEAELARGSEPRRAARLHYEIARLLEHPLADFAGAAEHYLKALEGNPEHLPTLTAARRVLLEQKQYERALPLFDAEAKLSGAPEARALLLYEKGRWLEDVLGQSKQAREAYAAAVELDPTNPTVLKATERAAARAEAWDALERTYDRAATALPGDPPLRAAVVAQRARLLEKRQGDARAASELYQTALELDGRAPGAADALKRLHYTHQRWQDLVNVLAREADSAADPELRAMALYRIGRIQLDRLGKLDEGIAALEAAARETPLDRTVLEELARAYERSRRYAEHASTLERWVSLANAPNERLGLRHRIGQIYEERLNDPASAITWYSRELEDDPTYQPSLQALAKLYARRQQWEPLIAMHLAEAAATPDRERRASAFARVADLLEIRLGDPQAAVAHHARALGVVPGYPPSFKALVRLYTQAERWRELAELYESALDEAVDLDAKVTYLFKLGRLHEDALGAPAQAVTAYRRILELAPKHLEALHALQRAAERASAWKELIAALETEASLHAAPAAKLPLYHRAGEICEQHLDDVDAALAFYRRAIELEPGYAPALGSMGRLFYRQGRWDDLLDVYRRELRVTPRGAQSAALLYKIGELSETHLGQDELALQSYREAIAHDAFHLPSLRALGRKLSELSQWDELVRLLELELSATTEPSARARTAFRAGEVYENRLNQPKKARAAYEQALAAVPDFRPALDGRSRLLAQADEFRELVEDLDREASAPGDPLVAVAARYRQAEIYRDELGDRARATAAFEAVLERDPAHLGALLALEGLYAAAGASEPLSRVYAAQARVMTSTPARVAALRELARLQRRPGGEGAERAKQTYFSILELDPSDRLALRELERLALEARDQALLTHVDAKLSAFGDSPGLAAAHHTRLAEALEAAGDASALAMYRAALAAEPENLAATRGITRLAEASGDPTLLEEAAEREARVTLDTARASTLLVLAAEQRRARGDAKGAAGALGRALGLNPDEPRAADRLVELLLAQNAVGELLATLTRAAHDASSPERKAALWGQVAGLLAEQQKDLPAALAALNRVAEEQPNHAPTLMQLGALYARDQQWPEAVARYEQVLKLGAPQALTSAAHLRLAEIRARHLNDPAGATADLESVLKQDESQRDALALLLEVQVQRGQSLAAADTAARLVRLAPDPAARAQALCSLARLEQSRGEADRAIDAYAEALPLVGIGPIAKEFKELLNTQMLLGKGRWQSYVDALGRYLEQGKLAPAEQAAVYLEMGRVLDDELKSSDKALQALQRGLALTPKDIELRAELALRLKRAGHLQQAADEYRKLLDFDVMRADAWRELAEALRGMQRADEATLALAPLVAIGVASDLERSTLASRPPRAPQPSAQVFDSATFKLADAVGQPDPASDLLASLAEGLSKIHPPDLERYGLTARDRISARQGHPLRAVGDRLAQVFGIPEWDLYLHRAHSGGLEVEFADPPAILVPAYVPNLSESQQTFLLARLMANLGRGLHPVDKYAPQAIELLLASAARNVQPSFGAGLSDEEFLSSEARRIHRILSRRGRRALEEAAQAYVKEPRLDVAEWALRVRMTAARAASLLADDLPGSISLVRRLEADLSGAQGPALSQGMRIVHDMLRYWVSDSAFSLRRRLGLM